MEEAINEVRAMMEKQAPPEEIMKMLMQKYNLKEEEAAAFMQKVAQSIQSEQGGGEGGEQRGQGGQKVSPEQAMQVIQQAGINPEHALVMLAICIKMSLKGMADLAEMLQGGGGQQQAPQEQQEQAPQEEGDRMSNL